MSKKEISWIELINVMIAERKKEGKPAGVRDVMGDAKKEWVIIKSGKHDTYIKGKPIYSATSMPIPMAPVATPAITSGLPYCFSICLPSISRI